MDISGFLLQGHSRKQADRLAERIGSDKVQLAVLMKLILRDKPLLSQRASWVMGILGGKHQGILRPYYSPMINMLTRPVHPAVKRNIVKIFQHEDVSVRLQGKLANALFHLIRSPDEPVAVKAYSITALGRLCRLHPDLKNEFRAVILDQFPFASGGFIARAKRELNLSGKTSF